MKRIAEVGPVLCVIRYILMRVCDGVSGFFGGVAFWLDEGEWP